MRLHTRRADIEQTILARMYAIADPGEVGDPLYVDGLKSAISAAVNLGL
jgi:hypothetical protein